MCISLESTERYSHKFLGKILQLKILWIKNKERPLGEVKWAWHRKSRETWAGPCNHLDTWVGLSFLELLAIAVQTANAQKTEVGGAGHVNARHGWGWT